MVAAARRPAVWRIAILPFSEWTSQAVSCHWRYTPQDRAGNTIPPVR
jgi:hypothetical protein